MVTPMSMTQIEFILSCNPPRLWGFTRQTVDLVSMNNPPRLFISTTITCGSGVQFIAHSNLTTAVTRKGNLRKEGLRRPFRQMQYK